MPIDFLCQGGLRRALSVTDSDFSQGSIASAWEPNEIGAFMNLVQGKECVFVGAPRERIVPGSYDGCFFLLRAAPGVGQPIVLDGVLDIVPIGAIEREESYKSACGLDIGAYRFLRPGQPDRRGIEVIHAHPLPAFLLTQKVLHLGAMKMSSSGPVGPGFYRNIFY